MSMKKQFWMAVLACGISVLGGCGSSSGAGSEITNAEELSLQETASVEKLIERYNSMHSMCRGDSDVTSNENETQQACSLRDKIAERLTNEDYCFLQSEQQWLSCEATEEAEAAEVLADDAFIVVKKRKPNFSELEMTVAVDSVTVNDIKVNKGNCLRSYVYGSGSKFPMDLKFGDKIYMGVFCDPIRLDFDTSSGGWWYQWS
jgi:hypothetical protein